MEDRPEFSGWELVGAAVVLVILLAITAHAVGWSDGVAAWVQAIGTILALGATGGLAVWEARQRRTEGNKREAARLRARIALLGQATACIEAFIKDHPKKSASAKQHHRAINYMLEASQQVDFAEMPNPSAVRRLAIHKAVASVILDSLEDTRDDWLPSKSLDKLKERAAVMRACVQWLTVEANIVERSQ